MTTLLERCQALSVQMDQLEVARRNANVRMLVQERTKEWSDRYARLKGARERAAWLSLSDANLPAAAAKVAQLRHNAAESLTRLNAGENVSSLTEDAMWTRLLQSAEGAAEALNEGVKTAWRS